MGKKIWLSMNPGNFGSDKIVRTSTRPPLHVAGVKFCISSTPRVSAVSLIVETKKKNKVDSLYSVKVRFKRFRFKRTHHRIS